MSISRQDQQYLKKLTVLYVEDDEEAREQFAEFLGRPVGKLVAAENGAEGLKAFTEHAPDIVITDILMPVMDGLSMAYEIRAVAPNVPIIILTAFEQTDYLMRAINIGVDKYVTKPVNSYLLFEKLLECAHRLRAEDQFRIEQQRQVQAMKLKYHETISMLANGIARNYDILLSSYRHGHPAASTEAPVDLSPSLSAEIHSESQVLTDMLKLLESDAEALKPQPLIPLAKEVVNDLLSSTSINCSFDYSDELAAVNVPERQLRFLFNCLTANSIDAMPSGGMIQISTCTRIFEESDDQPLTPGSYLYITFSDTGTGIAPQDLPAIFEPRFSTKQPGQRVNKGLSLAVCQAIVIQHDGNITVDPETDSGTVFNIWLPLAV